MHFASRLPFRHISWTGRDGRTRTCKSIIPNCYLLLFASRWRGIPGTIRCYFIDSEVWCRFTNTPKKNQDTEPTDFSVALLHAAFLHELLESNQNKPWYVWLLCVSLSGGSGAIRTPVPLAGQDVFKTSLVRPLEYTSNKNSTQYFALAILPSLLKPAIHAVAHVFIGFEPTIIHYQWIYNWICCMRHVNFTDSWLWSAWVDSNHRLPVPKTGRIDQTLDTGCY